MNGSEKNINANGGQRVEPSATVKRLAEANWIGLGLALDWIAMRGQSMTFTEHDERENQAAEQLVALLGDMPQAIAESTARGRLEGLDGPSVPIPSGVWRETATSDADDRGKSYRLLAVDDDHENDGSIRGYRIKGWTRVQVRADFVLDNWPEDSLEIAVRKSRPATAQAEVRRWIERVIADVPAELGRLTGKEICDLVLLLLPNARRDHVRLMVREYQPEVKRGPRGPRQPERNLRLAEFGEKMRAAKLRN